MFFQAVFNFKDFVDFLVASGTYTYFLPFVLIFAIFFAILEKTQIFGATQRGVNVIVSLVAGLLILVQPGIVDTINNFLPRVSLIMVVILVSLLIISMVAGNKFRGVRGWALGAAIICIGIAIFIALSPGQILSSDDKEMLLRIGIPLGMVIAVIAVAMGVGGGGTSGPRTFLEELATAFGGRGPRGGAGGGGAPPAP